MKLQKQTAVFFIIAFLVGVIFTSCSSSDDPAGEEEDRNVGVPTGLSYEYNRAGETRLFWNRVENAGFYQLVLNDKSYTVMSTYCTLTDKLPYDTEYIWKVRAGRKLTVDTVYSEWATSTLSLPVPLSMKFQGIWSADSVSVDVYMGVNSLPVDSFLPDRLDVSLLSIEVTEDENDGNSVSLSIAGLKDFLPVEEQHLSSIPVEADKNTGMIYGEIAINPDRSKITQTFDPPLRLSDLGLEDVVSTIPTVTDDIAINSFTLAFTRAAVSGRLENAESTKAQYEIRVTSVISIDTGDPLVNLVNLYLQNNPVFVILDACCTKVPESD